jgi:hypothetical protein
MANISKAKEIYKSISRKIRPDTPLVKIRGLYVAGTYRPPYLIKPLLNMVKIGGVNSANVAYYTQATDTSYVEKNGILQLKSIEIGEVGLINYTETSDSGYVEPEGILQLKSIEIGEVDIVFFGNDDDSAYVEKNGILQLKSIEIGSVSIMEIPFVRNVQPPGQPVLNVKSFNTISASIT